MRPSVCTVCGCRVFTPTDDANLFECVSCQTIWRVLPVQRPDVIMSESGPLYTLTTEEEDTFDAQAAAAEKAVTLD